MKCIKCGSKLDKLEDIYKGRKYTVGYACYKCRTITE